MRRLIESPLGAHVRRYVFSRFGSFELIPRHFETQEHRRSAHNAHITHVRNMRDKDDIIYNKERSTNIKYFASLPLGLLLKKEFITSKIGATLKGKNLLRLGANSFLEK